MTKGDIINIVAEGTGLTKLETSAVVDGFLATVGYALQTGDSVTIRGFGTFRTVHRKERISKNPKTGKVMHVPDRISPVFKASNELKKMVDQSHKKNFAEIGGE